MQIAPPVVTIGWVIAVVVLILCVIFAVIGQLPVLLAALIGGVAIARLL
jgi:hypothetical protein